MSLSRYKLAAAGALALLAGCAPSGTRIYGPASILSDGTTFAITVPPGSQPSQVSFTSPVAWNSTVLILNGRDLQLTSPIPDDALIKSAGGYVFRHANRITSRTQVTIPASAFLSPTGTPYDAHRDPPKTLDAFYTTTSGESVHWRAPLTVLSE